ncbi:MAG: hypothetical protein R3D59_12860 [Paracoccaceae bacterium]
MHDVIFIGDGLDARAYGDAGIPSFAPPRGLLAERVMAEKRRCRVLAMTEGTFSALPADLARELREGCWPQVTIVPELTGEGSRARAQELIRAGLAKASARYA